jgi:N-acetylglucosaminyldiphosphoundecaprenol N-acetyl-beta-D-mannosaminyltransferase
MSYRILGMKVSAVTCLKATQNIVEWAVKKESRYICLANVHMTMEAYDSGRFRQIINSADLVAPDGKPLSWILQTKFRLFQSEQVCGRDLTHSVCQAAATSTISVGFYGSTPDVLSALVSNIKRYYPNLNVVYAYSPPFRPLTLPEKQGVIRDIKASGVQILFVGLGCPKQERWMAEHKDIIQAVMIGIGGAFDMIAGVKQQVPSWMQMLGLEWLFRLCLEPQRLWYRNFYYSPRFVFVIIKRLCLSLARQTRLYFFALR